MSEKERTPTDRLTLSEATKVKLPLRLVVGSVVALMISLGSFAWKAHSDLASSLQRIELTLSKWEDLPEDVQQLEDRVRDLELDQARRLDRIERGHEEAKKRLDRIEQHPQRREK